MNPDLIFDIGMNNGDDTAYYLHRGFKVVAVEADPDLALAGRERFAAAIAEGRLTLVNKAIAVQPGEADFWICDELRVWNSFDKSIASRNGLPCHAIKVQTLPLRDLLAEYGVPYYLKVDIEGHDHIAIADVSPSDAPEFISMELNSVDDFYLLRSKGYQRFKCIQQGYFTQVLSPRLSFQSALSMAVTRLKSTPLANRLRAAYKEIRPSVPATLPSGVWAFDPGSSGPFGDETAGEWLPFEDVMHAWLSQQLGHKMGYRVEPANAHNWYDLHAAKK